MVSRAGKLRAFFEPGTDCIARHSEGLVQAAQAAALLIGSQNSLALLENVTFGSQVSLVLATTAATAVALLAGGFTAVLDQVFIFAQTEWIVQRNRDH